MEGMKMPTCQSCHQQWTWKETLKAGFVIDIGMTCPHCGSKQYPTAKTRRRNFLLYLAILMPMILPIFNISAIYSLIFIFIMGAFILLIQPLFTELSNEDTSLG